MVIDRVLRAAPPGTRIPKPAATAPFKVRRVGKRRGERALIYTIPNHNDPTRPYEKGITATEFEKAYARLKRSGELTHGWFRDHLPGCAAEGSCNFTSLGGLFVRLGIAAYDRRGVYRDVDRRDA